MASRKERVFGRVTRERRGETRSPIDFEDGFRDFAARGFSLIFDHGYEYTDAAISVARDFPNTYFVVSSGSESSRNVASLTFKVDDAAFVEWYSPAAFPNQAW